MGARYELEQLRRGPEVGEGNQEGFDDFEGIGVFDDFLFVTQVKLLPDCASLLSGSRYCQKDCNMLFELARISKIFG